MILNNIKRIIKFLNHLLPVTWYRKLSRKKRFYLMAGVVAFLLITIPTIIYTLQNSKSAEAWFNNSWQYRKAINISNSGSTLGVFQVPLSIDSSALVSAGKMRSDCNDVRVTDINGKILKHWIQNCNSSSTIIWPTVQSIPTSGITVYLYYGNPNASSNRVKQGTEVNPGLSCKAIKESGDSNGSGNYWIDKNNGNFSDKENVYCDMTNNNGGWMLVKPSMVDSFHEQNVTKVASTDSNGGAVYTFTNTETGCGGAESGAAVKITNSIQWDLLRVKESIVTGSAACWSTQSDGNWGGHQASSNMLPFSAPTDTLQNCVLSCSTAPFVMPPMTRCDNAAENFARLNTSSERSFETVSRRANRTTMSGPAIGLSCNTDNMITKIENIYIKENSLTYSQLSNSFSSEEIGSGPMGYWKFDEGSGTTANDSSGRKKTGTFLSAPVWKSEDQCVSGKCLAFDNVDDGVSIPNENYTSLTNYTMCAWVNPKGTHKHYTGTIMSSGDWNNTHWAFGVSQTNGAIQTRKADGVNSPTWNYTIPLNQWSYICITRSGTTVTAYANGKQVGSPYTGTTGNLISNATNTTIGRETYASGYFAFNGLIDEPKIYNYARSINQINADYNSRGSVKGVSSQIAGNNQLNSSLSKGLVAYWEMNEATWSGTLNEVIDLSGNGNNGTSQGATDAKAYPTVGKFGKGGYFDSVDDYISNTTFTAFGTSIPFSMSTWFKTSTSYAYEPGIISLGASPVIVMQTNGSIKAWWYNGTTWPAIATTGTAYNDGKFHHAMLTYDGTTARLYVDGELKASTNSTINAIYGGIYLGQESNNGPKRFNGVIDEARVYNRALSPTEVSSLYNWAPGPVGYWNFEEKSGVTTYNKSSNSCNPTLTNNPSWTSGKYGGGLRFNGGSTQHTTCSDSTDSPLDISDQVTISAWYKVMGNPYNGYHVIAQKDGGYSGGAIYGLRVSGSGPNSWTPVAMMCNNNVDIDACNSTTSTKTISTGEWHYITMTYDKSYLKLFIDGILVSSKSETRAMMISNDNFRIGYGDGRVANGVIDELKVYNYIRSPGQIVEDMNAGHPVGGSPVGSQLAYWKLNEGYGSSSVSTVNKYALVHYNSPIWINDGKFGKALDFDGLNDHLMTTGVSDPFEYRGEDFALSLWVNQDSGENDNGTILSKPWNGSGQYNYQIILNSNDTLTFVLHGTTSWSTTTTSTLPTAAWSHIGVTVENVTKNVKIYINGKLVKSTTHNITDWTPTSGDSNVPLSIGTYYPYGPGWAGNVTFSFDGKIDEIKIYNSLLTDSQMKLEYNQGGSLVLGSFSDTSQLTGGSVASSSASSIYCVPGDNATCSPPVAEWNFEEKQGIIANDISGNGNIGTLPATAGWTRGYVGTGINFIKESNQYISISNESNFDFTTAVTTQAWINISSNDSYAGIISKTSSNTNGWEIRTTSAQGGIQCRILNGVDLGASTTISLNAWHHLACTYSTSDNLIKLYIDGRLANSVSGSNGIATNDNLPLIGGLGYVSSLGFTGKIDQVKVFNYARTPAQVTWDYNQGKPVGHWKFDECQGLTLGDSSGNGNSGTLTIGGTVPQTTAGTCASPSDGTGSWYNGRSGKYNSSLNFDGVDDYVDVPTNVPIGAGAYTVSAWINPVDSADANRIIVTDYLNWDFRLGDCGSNASLNFTRWSDWSSVTVGCGGISYNSWQHVLFVYNLDDTVDVYINGIKRTTGSKATTRANRPIRISYSSAGHHFAGQIDDVRIYNYALTPTQIKQIMNQGSAVRWGPATGIPN